MAIFRPPDRPPPHRNLVKQVGRESRKYARGKPSIRRVYISALSELGRRIDFRRSKTPAPIAPLLYPAGNPPRIRLLSKACPEMPTARRGSLRGPSKCLVIRRSIDNYKFDGSRGSSAAIQSSAKKYAASRSCINKGGYNIPLTTNHMDSPSETP